MYSICKFKSIICKDFTLRSLRKYGLQADSTTLCAVNCLELQANVTSTKSSSSFSLRNEETTDWEKLSHLNRNLFVVFELASAEEPSNNVVVSEDAAFDMIWVWRWDGLLPADCGDWSKLEAWGGGWDWLTPPLVGSIEELGGLDWSSLEDAVVEAPILSLLSSQYQYNNDPILIA